MNRQQVIELLTMTAKVQGVRNLEDDMTGQAWHRYLSRYDYLDGVEAIDNLVQSDRRPDQPYVFTIRDVLAEIRSIRGKRLNGRRHMLPSPPPETQGTESAHLVAYQEWKSQVETRASNRDWNPPPRELDAPARPIQSIVRRIAQIRNPNRGEGATS